ncbi:MAG: hypothetical protein LBC14_01730 [Desulfovibrio sp.]|nr:hypothetical protein [Desulfovibrio sp.]
MQSLIIAEQTRERFGEVLQMFDGMVGNALQEIVDPAAGNSSVVASIAAAAEEQSATSEEINGALEEIRRIVNETAGGMIRSSSAVHELSQMAQDLNRVIEQLTAR